MPFHVSSHVFLTHDLLPLLLPFPSLPPPLSAFACFLLQLLRLSRFQKRKSCQQCSQQLRPPTTLQQYLHQHHQPRAAQQAPVTALQLLHLQLLLVPSWRCKQQENSNEVIKIGFACDWKRISCSFRHAHDRHAVAMLFVTATCCVLCAGMPTLKVANVLSTLAMQSAHRQQWCLVC